jgi:hypothetical protein
MHGLFWNPTETRSEPLARPHKARARGTRAMRAILRVFGGHNSVDASECSIFAGEGEKNRSFEHVQPTSCARATW